MVLGLLRNGRTGTISGTWLLKDPRSRQRTIGVSFLSTDRFSLHRLRNFADGIDYEFRLIQVDPMGTLIGDDVPPLQGVASHGRVLPHSLLRRGPPRNHRH